MVKLTQSNHLFIFGLGYVGQHLATELHRRGWQITGTTRNPEKLKPNLPHNWQILRFEDGNKIPGLSTYLSKASHVITTISALAGYDPVMKKKSMYQRDMKLDGRNKYVKKAIKDLMDRQQKRKDRAAKKKALNYNPYFKPFDGSGKGSSN